MRCVCRLYMVQQCRDVSMVSGGDTFRRLRDVGTSLILNKPSNINLSVTRNIGCTVLWRKIGDGENYVAISLAEICNE